MGKLGKNKNLASDQTKPLSFGKATGIINKEKSLATFRDVLFIKELSVGLIKSRLWVKNMLVWVESITADTGLRWAGNNGGINLTLRKAFVMTATIAVTLSEWITLCGKRNQE